MEKMKLRTGMWIPSEVVEGALDRAMKLNELCNLSRVPCEEFLELIRRLIMEELETQQ